MFMFSLPLVVLVRLSVPVQVTDWKDSSPSWPILCWCGRWTDAARSLTSCELERPRGSLSDVPVWIGAERWNIRRWRQGISAANVSICNVPCWRFLNTFCQSEVLRLLSSGGLNTVVLMTRKHAAC